MRSDDEDVFASQITAEGSHSPADVLFTENSPPLEYLQQKGLLSPVAPSTLAVVGRYVLTPAIFDELERVGQGAGGEIQLTDGIARLLLREPVFAHRFTGRRFDCGSKLGYLQATVELSLAHPALGKDFRRYLKHLAATLDDIS